MLYDADCGFCTRAAQQVHRLGVRAEVVTIQASDLKALRIDPDRAEREMPFVGDDGSVTYGHVAWAETLKTGPLPTKLLGQVIGSRVIAPLAARVYRWVSTHRTRLPGGTPECALPPRTPSQAPRDRPDTPPQR